MGLLTVNFKPPPVLDKLIKDLEQPFAGKVGKAAMAAIRTGPSSLTDQLRRKKTISGHNVSRSWEKRDGGPFRQSHSGKLARAWNGGPGGFSKVKDNTITVGLDRSLPYAKPWFKDGTTLIQRPLTFVTITPKMRVFLGKKYGVWTKRTTGILKIPGSPVSLNRRILDRVGEILFARATGKQVDR